MTDEERRDTFAAAALTGLLGSGDINVDPSDNDRAAHVAELAYQWADAMLRARAKTTHDAAPAARGDARAFALTETERYVLREVRDTYAGQDDINRTEIAFVLDALLARLKGGK